jgi:hypothetical protein
MALQKTIELANGANAQYWRVDEVNIQYGTEECTISMYIKGYLDASAREDGHIPMTQKFIQITDPTTWTAMCGTDGRDDSSNNPKRLSYLWIKANSPEFSGAIDC